MREKEIKGWRREKKEKIIISLDTKAPNGEACSEERSDKR
jgi:predicted GIY-YIG superfamily endonuclease